MPHRTVFQWGKNHAHPFTMFLGGFVMGVLVTGAVAYAWVLADEANPDFDNAIPGKTVSTASPNASATPKVTASPSAGPQF